MTDTIEEIRARHDDIEENWVRKDRVGTPYMVGMQGHADRAALLPIAERCLAAEARVAELEEELKPFAEEGRKWANCIDADDQYILIAHPIDVIVDSDGEISGINDAAFRLGDLRRAAQSLKETP